MTRNEELSSQVHAVFRRGAWIAAIVAILVGAFGLIFPAEALRSVALLFGIYLVVAGITRVYTAVTGSSTAAGPRWFIGVVGVLVVIAGILCLNNPFGSLIAIEVIIGLGWMLDGVICIITAIAVLRAGTRTALVLTGIVSLVLGVLVILIPGAAIVGFLFLAAIFLVVIGVVGVVSLVISGSRRAAVLPSAR